MRSKMTKFNIRLFAIFATFLLGAMTAFSQSTTTGGISGKVVDPQNAIVRGATVTVTNTGTNEVQTTTTGDDGVFKVLSLPPGLYKVEITSSGFGKSSADVVVEVGAITPVDMGLRIGEAAAEVVITAEAPVVNTNDPTN